MSVLPAFDHARATSVGEALGLISESSLPYHGGTELLLAMRAGFLRPDRLVDLKRVEELQAITEHKHAVVIGGGVTHSAAASSTPVSSRLPMLAEVLNHVGNLRVRASGTLAGNLCFAEPKSDVGTALIALGAAVTLVSAEGRREVPVERFIVGPYTTTRTSAEILTEITVPVIAGRRAAYHKFQTMERPTVGVAIALTNDRARLVVGAIGPMPQLFDAPGLADLQPDAIADRLDIISDLTGAEDFKRHVARISIARVLAEVSA